MLRQWWWSLALAIPIAILAAVGTGIGFHFSAGSLSATRSALTSLGLDASQVPFVGTGPQLATATTALTAATISQLAVLLSAAIVRAWLVHHYSLSEGSLPRTTSFWFINLARSMFLPLCWLNLMFLVLWFALSLAWLGIAYLVDQGTQHSTELASMWALLRQALSSLSSLYRGVGTVGALASLDPALVANLTALATGGSPTCPVYCLDLSAWPQMLPPPLSFPALPAWYVSSGSQDSADGGSCVCDLARLQSVQSHAEQVWSGQLCWAMLGLGLAVAAMSWLLMGLTSALALTTCERRHPKLEQIRLELYAAAYWNSQMKGSRRTGV